MLTKNLIPASAKKVKITYHGITYGNFLAYGPAGTAAELRNSIQVQLWGNISFGLTASKTCLDRLIAIRQAS